MKKFFLFVVLFLLSFSLALAVDISTSKTEYAGGEKVSATISNCVGTSIVKFLNPGSTVVDIKSGKNNWSVSYNTLSDSADGKYAVSATCENGVAQSSFCVDAPGCMPATSSTSTTSTTSGSEGKATGTSGASCTSDWRCGDWSYCGPTLTQTRSCVDINRCQSPRDESRACPACQESWVCSLWAGCNSGTQNRVCYDEHFCETAAQKPALQKECNQVDPAPVPARVSYQLPPPYVPPAPPAASQNFFSTLWEDYQVYILGGAAVIVLVTVILLVIYLFKPKTVAYNVNELKQWVRKEKEMGTPEDDIKQILKQNTGWTDPEIAMALEGSEQSSRAANTKKNPI